MSREMTCPKCGASGLALRAAGSLWNCTECGKAWWDHESIALSHATIAVRLAIENGGQLAEVVGPGKIDVRVEGVGPVRLTVKLRKTLIP